MLQWMGGSRQKVKVTTRSTQKRQKQYFEQRRHHQHKHIHSSLGSDVDGFNQCPQQQKDHRSLDVLSLLNVPTVSEGCTTCHYEVNHPVEPCQKTKSTLAVTTDAVACAETLSSQHVKVMPHEIERFQAGTYKPQDTSLKETFDKSKEFKDASEPKFLKLSILDLIGDNETNECTEECTEHEPHVAFSLEGLGELGTETPVHSSPPHYRIFPNGRSYLPNSLKRHRSPKTFSNIVNDHKMDVKSWIWGDDLHSWGKYLGSGCQSRIVLSHVQPGGVANELVDFKRANTDVWDVGSFFKGELFDEDLETKSGSEYGNAVHFIGTSSNEDFLYQDLYSPNRAHWRSSHRFSNLDSAAQYTLEKQEAVDYSSMTSDESKYFINPIAKQASPSYSILEDLGDSRSKPARNHHYHSPCFTTPREELLAVSDVLFDSHLGFDGSKDDFFLESAWHPMEFSSEKFACSQRHCDAVTSVRSSSSQNTSTFNRSRLGFCYYDGEFDKNVQSSDSSKFSGKEFLNQDLSVASEMGASGNVCKAVGKINSDKPEEEIYFGSNGGKKENLEKGRASNEAQYVNIPEEVLTEEDANDFKSCTDNEECHGDGLALSQKTIEDEDDEEDGRDDGRKSIASEEQNASPMVPSCQLMMLESYVLQLLRVPNSKKKDVMSFDDGR